jgi:ABC-2 type transport system ATP-binding protein
LAVVEAHELTRNFGTLTAVEDLSLEMEKGEVLAFLGPNGAGKTTTIRMLSGIITPTRGYAVIAGHRTDRELQPIHESIGLLTETPGFYDALTAIWNLGYYARFYNGLDVDKQIEKYLKITGLWDRRDVKVGTYSKGMKQRLALARALVHEPEVIFLDEPTAALDPEAAREVRELVRNLSHEGRTIFLSTHNLTEAEQLCSRIAVVQTHLLALDTPANLRQRLFRRQVVVQLDGLSESIVELVRGLPFVRNTETIENQIVVELNEPEKTRPELVRHIVEAGGRIMAVSEQQHSLEEVYLNLMNEN